jgi:hypothetical protein
MQSRHLFLRMTYVVLAISTVGKLAEATLPIIFRTQVIGICFQDASFYVYLSMYTSCIALSRL